MTKGVKKKKTEKNLTFITDLTSPAPRRAPAKINCNRSKKTNKLINFLFIVIVILVLLFSYIQNVSYLVTILGFASAGIAIALKDWFMSIFG